MRITLRRMARENRLAERRERSFSFAESDNRCALPRGNVRRNGRIRVVICTLFVIGVN